MKRFTLLATAVVGLAVATAACSDTATQPVMPTLSAQEAELSALEAKYGGRSPASRLAACLAATGNNTLLCTRPLTAVCNALRASTETGFTFTIRIFGREVTYTVTIQPNANGAMIVLARAGVPIGSRQVSTAAIARLCSGGGIDNDDDDDRD